MLKSAGLFQRDSFRVPLIKLSVAVDPNSIADGKPTTRFSWIHYQNDAAALFDFPLTTSPSDTGTFSDPSLMSCTAGGRVLVTANLADRAREAQDALSQARRFSIQLRADQLPTSAVHKRPACTIALRFPADQLPEHTTRVQLKLCCVADYDKVIGCLIRLGVHVTPAQGKDARPVAFNVSSMAQRAVQAPALSSSNGGTIEVLAEAQSTNKVSSHTKVSYEQAVAKTTTPFDLPQMRINFGNMHEEEERRPQNVGPHSAPTVSHNSDLCQQIDATPATAEVNFTSRIGQCGPASTAPGSMPPYSACMVELADRPSTAQPYQAVSANSTTYRVSHPEGSRREPEDMMETAATRHRPSTAPLKALEDDLAAMVPPRRDLPFSRAPTRQGRHASIALELPALPRPTMKNGTRHGKEVKHSMNEVESEGEASADKAELATAGVTASAKRRMIVKPKAANKTRSVGHSSSPVKFSDDTSAAVMSEATIATTLSPMRSSQEVLSLLSAEQSYEAHRDNLAKYSAKSYDSRKRSIDALVMYMLNDDNFTNLVEDVEGCWRRIGLERHGHMNAAHR